VTPFSLDLAIRACRGERPGYRALALAHAIEPPGQIAAVAAALEATMAEDAAAGRPFRAAIMTARGQGGLPAPGFFAAARSLAAYAGADAGPEAADFVAAARRWWAEAIPAAPDALWALARHEALRPALPAAVFPAAARPAADLAGIAADYDAFVLGAGGVLECGDAPLPGAVEAVAALQAQGRRVLVLSNDASRPAAAAAAACARRGFRFAPGDIITARALAAAALPALMAAHPGPWAAIGAAAAPLDDLPGGLRPLDAGLDAGLLAAAAGFVFLGTQGWSEARQAALEAALACRPRPVLCANPDLVASRGGGFSLEPGAFCHRLAGLGHAVRFLGKPFPEAFAAIRARLPGLPAGRIAMVGDSLHADILGAAAAGIAGVLVTGQGLLRGIDPGPVLAATGIVPDRIIPGP
jgi:ribonucleotide monophosphatase NagD (HAD superfamily)